MAYSPKPYIILLQPTGQIDCDDQLQQALIGYFLVSWQMYVILMWSFYYTACIIVILTDATWNVAITNTNIFKGYYIIRICLTIQSLQSCWLIVHS